jgi:hypothetical protein
MQIIPAMRALEALTRSPAEFTAPAAALRSVGRIYVRDRNSPFMCPSFNHLLEGEKRSVIEREFISIEILIVG